MTAGDIHNRIEIERVSQRVRDHDGTRLRRDCGFDALRHAGANPTAAKLHDYIEGLHDWAGIAGIYYFRDNSQRGIGQNALQAYRWDAGHGTFVVASRPGGSLK